MSGNLKQIPGVGPAIERYLNMAGVNEVDDLRGRKPRQLYDAVCAATGMRQDPCLLYTFGLAVYYAENEVHDAELLKWWNWKDRV